MKNRIPQWRRQFDAWRKSDRGNVAIVFALSTPLVVGSAAFSVETSFGYLQQTELQAAADAAAYAGALENRAGRGWSAIDQAARATAIENGWSDAEGDLTTRNPPDSGPNQTNNAVEVELSEDVPRFFTALFSDEPLIVRARSVAIHQQTSNACVLALNRTAGRAVDVTGSSVLTATGCDVVSNSVASDSLRVWGSGRMRADCALAAGKVANHGGLTTTVCKSAISSAPRVADPFAHLPWPSSRGPNQGSVPRGKKGTQRLYPGYYPDGMNFSGDYIMEPGNYYVAGDFRASATDRIWGTGVTVFMASGSQVWISGSAVAEMTAPTTGTYAGMLFVGDPSSPGVDHRFTGNSAQKLTGHIYFPKDTFKFSGSNEADNGCVNIVADKVDWQGNAEVRVDCTSKGMVKIPAQVAIRLVE